MNKVKELIKKSYEKKLLELVEKNGGPSITADEIWDNIHYLASKVQSFGEEILVLTLQVKKMLAYIIDPDYHIEYEVVHGTDCCSVEAKLYWAGEEKPAGVGFSKRYRQQIFPKDSLSSEERDSSMEASVRGLAASRALTDAGIGMQFYGDVFDHKFDIFEGEEAAATETRKKMSKVPEIPSAEEKKKAKVAAKKSVPPKVEPATVPPAEEKVEKQPTVKTENTAMDLEKAKNAICDKGTYAGNPLGAVYQASPRNLIWLINNGSEVADAARAIVMSDPDLKEFLK